MTEYNTINVHELKNLLDSNSGLCVIDVREQYEWDHGHIPGVAHIPKDELITRISEQVSDKNQPIYLYCQAGVRSAMAAQWLVNAGYNKVFSVDGGFGEWASSAYPVI